MDPVIFDGFLHLQTAGINMTSTLQSLTLSEATSMSWNSSSSSLILPPVEVPDPGNVLGKIGAAVIILIIVVGLTGNVQVLVVIARCPRLHRSYNVFIASLSATDLVFNALILPFFVDSYLHRSWRYPSSLCHFLTYFGAMMLLTSGLHIGLIAVNRYVLIVHPRRFLDVSSPSAIACQITCVWIVALVIVLPGALGWQAAVGYSDQLGRCNYLRSESRVTLSVIFCVGFILPCAIMGYCYVVIWRTAVRSQRRICLHRTPQVTHRGRQEPLELIRVQTPSSAVTAAGSVMSTPCSSHPLLPPPRESAGSTAQRCRKKVAKCAGDESLSFVRDEETTIGSLTPVSPAGPLMPVVSLQASPRFFISSLRPTVYPGLLWAPRTVSTLGTTVSPGHLMPPRPVRSPGLLRFPRTSLSPAPPMSSASVASPATLMRPGPLPSTNLLQSPGNFCKSPTGTSLCTEAKDSPGSSDVRLSRPIGSDSPPTEPTVIVGQEGLDGGGGLRLEGCCSGTSGQPLLLRPDLNEQPLLVTTSINDSATIPKSATVHRSKLDAHQSSTCCLDFWCTQAEPSMTVSYADCDSRFSHPVCDGDEDDVDRSRCQINRVCLQGAAASSRSIAGRGRLSSLRMILVIFLAFVLTYLPFALMNLCDEGSRLHRSWYMTASLGFWAGSCVNPIIYGIMNKQFRKAYGALLSIPIRRQ